MKKELKLLFILFFAFATIITLNTPKQALGSGKIIYTAATKGNSDNSGNGTQSNPYNLFETALLNANDGDTIYILDAGGFVNASDNSPLVINKNITIKGANSVLSVRRSGIVLGADVTFENVVLSFGSRYHDAIFANGHSLTMKNVSCQSGSRKVDIFGGGLYINGVNTTSSGSQAVITISGGGANFGNIYLGALNGDFSGSVTVNLTNMTSARNTEIYISGADEPYVNLDDLFSLTEPAAPSVNINHTISGNATITIKECNVPLVSQAANTSGKTKLTVDTNGKYYSSISVNNLDELVIKGGGVFAPTSCTNIDKILLSAGGIDWSNTTAEVKSLVSNGVNNKIILGKEQYLVVSSHIEGGFVFETVNGYNGHSGPATYDFAYIRVGNNATLSNVNISYTCVPGMEMSLERINSYTATDTGNSYKTVWKTSEASEYSPFPIKGLRFTNSTVTIKRNDFSNSVIYNAIVEVSNELMEQDCYFDLVPIQYNVKYMGNEYKGVAQYDGYSYYADIAELKLSFMAMSDYDLSDAKICVYTYLDGSSATPELPSHGVYTISVLPFSDGEQIIQTVKLIITDENGEYPSEPPSETPSEGSSEPSNESTGGMPSKPSNESTGVDPSKPSNEPIGGIPSKPSDEHTGEVPSNPSNESPSESISEPSEESSKESTDETIEDASEEVSKEEQDESLAESTGTETDKNTNEDAYEDTTAMTTISDKENETTENAETQNNNDKKGNDKIPKVVIGFIIAGVILAVGFVGVFVAKRIKDSKKVD